MGVTAADFDGDGYPDIYVANDRTENFLFHNKQDGTFEEIAVDAGVAYGQNGESTSAMGPVFADIDGDGMLDLWVTDAKYNRLMHNIGKKQFEDIGAASGISPITAQYVSWGTGIYDFDNDGLLDILTFHGGLIHLVPEEHSVFRGLGKAEVRRRVAAGGAGVRREDGGARRMLWRLRQRRQGRCLPGEPGRPGDAVSQRSTNSGHWITIQLKGTKSNRDGIGAHLELTAGGKKQIAERVAGSGYLSQDDGRMHFGLGARDKGRQADREVAQRPRTGAGEPDRRSHRHRGGAEVSIALQFGARDDRRAVAARHCHRCRSWISGVRAGSEGQARLRRSRATCRPREMVLSPDGRWLYVMCEASDEVRVVDTQSGSVVKTVAVGHVPRGIAMSPDGKQLFVANSWDDTVSVIDTVVTQSRADADDRLRAQRRRSRSRGQDALRGQPPEQRHLGHRSGRAGRRPSGCGRTRRQLPDAVSRRQAAVLHACLSQDWRAPHAARVGNHGHRHRSGRGSSSASHLHNVAGVFHVAVSADGKLGVAAQLRPKNLVPLAHVEHGWAFGDSLALFGDDVGGVVQVPIDELDRYFAMPYAVAITPDKSKLYVSSSGAESITVIDIPKMLAYVRSASGPIANDLSASANYVIARIPVGQNPKGLLLSGDGKRLLRGQSAGRQHQRHRHRQRRCRVLDRPGWEART